MKTIKSLIIGALVALLGSSAWAGLTANPQNVSVTIGEQKTVTITATGSTSGNLSLDPTSSTYYGASLSASSIASKGSVTLTITGKAVTTSQQTLTVKRGSSASVPVSITVTEPPFVDHGEVSVSIAPEGTQTMTARSAAAADWTIWSDNEDVATVDPTSASGASATFTIAAQGGDGTVTTCVASNKYAKWTYKVAIDKHTEIERQTVNFSRGATEKKFDFTCADGKTTWYAWTDRPDLVSVKLESADPKVGFAAVRPTDAEKLTNAQSARLTVKHDLTNPSGTATVYVQAEGDSICHEVKIVCDAVNSLYFNMKHSDTLEEMSETSQSWYRIPTEWVKPEDLDKDHGHKFSSNTDVVEIKEEDGAFWLHTPEKGHDGVARVVFIKDENELLNGNGKIWMFNVTVNSVEIEKFLTFKDESKKDSEATLNIRTHYLDNVAADITNRVLFVGTGCDSHTLTPEKIAQTLTAIAKKAEVDYYIFEGGESVSAATSNGGVGTLQKGRSIAADQIRGLNGNQHCNLNGFFELFASLAQNPELRYKYDYIVMEFDAQRLAATPTSGQSDDYSFNQWRDVMVAEWLNEYYEGVKDSPGSRIIWIVDDQVNKTGLSMTNPKDLLNGSEAAEDFFRPYQAHISGSSNHFRYEAMSDDRFRALLAILNPWLYLEAGLQNAANATDLAARLDSCCGTHDYIFHQDSSTATAWDSPRKVRVGETYKYQAYYNDLDGLTKFLDDNIKVTSYAAQITDNVETQGLVFVEGTLKIQGSYDNAAWKDLSWNPQPGMAVSGTVWAVGNSITGVIENVTREFWSWITVDIKDVDEAFRVGAKYDAELGKYVRDPNLNTNALDVTEGEAAQVYFYDVTNPDGGVRAEATTAWDWEFDVRTIDLKAQGVDRPYDGTATNATYAVDPSDATVTVSYSADKGATWTDPEAYDAGKFTNVTNVQARFVATKETYFPATSTVDVVITPLTVTVSAVDTNKVYGADDPDPLPYAYDLSQVVAGEEELVKGLLDASAEAGAKFARVPGEDVNDDGYAITNDVPFSAGENYVVAYNPAKMTIAKASFGVTVTDYLDVYKGQGQGYTIGFTVDPAVAAKEPYAKTQVQFKLGDDGEWTDFEDYSATGDYSLIPLFTNVVNHAKVWVNAKNRGNYYETNFFGYVTITQRVVTVTAPQGLEFATDAEDATILSAVEDAVNVAGALSTEEAEAITFKTFCEPSHEAGQSDEVTFPTGDGYEENVEDQGNYRVVYVPGSIRFKDDTPRQDVLYPCGGCCRCLCLCCACTRTYVGSIYKPGEGLFGTISLKMTKTSKAGLADITATVTPSDGSAPLTFKKDDVRICGCRESTCTTKCTSKSKCGYFDFNCYGGFSLTSYGYGTNERYYFGWGVCKCGCSGSCDDHDWCKYDCDWGKCGWGSGDRKCESWCGKHDWGFGKCDHDCHKYDFGYGKSECDFGKYDCSASKYCWDFGKCGASFARPSDSCTRKVIKNRKIDCHDACIFSWGKYECSWSKTCCDWGKYDWGKCDKGKYDCDWGKYDCEKTHGRCVILCPLVINLEQTGLSCFSKSAHALSVSIVGDSMTGFFDMAYAVDGGRDVFQAPGDPKIQVGLNYVGIYNGVFDVTGADGEYKGEAAFALTVLKTGAALVKCTMPDGKDYACTTKIHVGANGFCAVPALLQHKSCDGSVRGIAFRVAFGPEPDDDLIRILNVSPWTVTGGKPAKTTELGTVRLSRFGLAGGVIDIGGAGKIEIGGKTPEEAAGKVHFRVPTILGDGAIAEKYKTYFEKVVTRGSVSGKWNVSFQLKADVLEAIRKGLKSASAKFEGLSDANARSIRVRISREEQTPGFRYGFVSSDDLFKIRTARPAKWVISTGASDIELEEQKSVGATSQFFALRVDKIDEEAGK